MNRIILLIIAWMPWIASAQQDSNPPQRSVPVSTTPPRAIPQAQQYWLNGHYKTISGLANDSATNLVRKTFPGLDDNVIEAMISEAGRLRQSDKQAELVRMRAILDGQRQEKQALLKRITEQQFQYEKTTDSSRRRAMITGIQSMKKELNTLEVHISEQEAAVGKAERQQ